jgi:hypothetical protein
MALTPESLMTYTPPQAEAAAEDDGRIARTVRLKPVHDEYLTRRAALTGVTPERLLETLVREAKRDDRLGLGNHTAPTGPGQPAGTSRR